MLNKPYYLSQLWNFSGNIGKSFASILPCLNFNKFFTILKKKVMCVCEYTLYVYRKWLGEKLTENQSEI